MAYPVIVSNNSLTIMYNGTTHTISSGMLNYEALRQAVRAQDWDKVPELLNPIKAIEDFGQGKVTVRDGEVLYEGEVVRNGLTQRILEMVKEGFNIEPMTKFMENLMANPSKTSVDELYSWLEGTSLPITEDGYFLAYKKVRDDYGSWYDNGKTMNRIGDKPSMPRNKVDDNRNRTCSQGLHFCSLSYLPNYHGGQGRVMILKINPADVVSIPSDYDNAKGRAWCYEVIGEHKGAEDQEAFDTSVVTAKGEPLETKIAKTRQVLMEDANTMVLGVRFNTPEQAQMAFDLMAKCSGDNVEPSTSEYQAKNDGFDDFWKDIPPTLHRFRGGNIRDAVNYAKAYFDSYNSAVEQKKRPAAPAQPATKPAAPARPGLEGYNKGRSDRARGNPYLAKNKYSGAQLQAYYAGYSKGYNSL